MEWYLKPWRKYADFSGRARRKEFWTFRLVNIVILEIIKVFAGISVWTNVFYKYSFFESFSFLSALPLIIFLLFGLSSFLPEIAVTVRRLHDTNRSGWFILLELVPIVGWILILVWFCTDSNLYENDYGPDPKAEEDANFYGADSI